VLFLATYSGFHGVSVVLLGAGFVSLALWLIAFGYRWLRTRPDLPAAGPEMSEIPAQPESPAVVNFLVNCWRGTPSGIAATVVDLAARRVLGLDLVGAGGTVVRLRDTPAKGSLTPYEERVYDLVASRATGGSAPIEAITLDENSAEGWTKRFQRAVIDEAREKGLARKRWEYVDYLIVGIGLAFVFGFFAFAFGAAHVGASSSTSSSDSSISRSDWLLGAGFAWFVAMGLVTRSQAVTDTPEGKAVCARWMGMRDYFRHSQAFEDQPPASVAIWDRLLAYGVATGTAREAAEGLPIVAEDPHSAWTRASGSWREIRIDYPSRFGFGQWPVRVFFEGIVRALFWGGIAFVVLPSVSVVGWQLLQDGLEGADTHSSEITLLVAFLGAMLTAVGLYLSARTFGGLVRLVRGARDLGKTETIEGEVVKVHNGRFAVDDGRSASVAALIVPPLQGIGRGQRVRVTVSPHLRHLSNLTVLSEAPRDPSAEPAAQALPRLAMGLGPLNIDAAALNQATGLSLRAVTDGGRDAGPKGLFIEQFEDGRGNHLTITRMPAMAAQVPLFSVVTKFASRGGEQVEGLGDSASWAKERALVVSAKDRLWVVDVDFGSLPAARRLEIAKAVAGVLLAGWQLPENADGPR
jgi:hypothetical protein